MTLNAKQQATAFIPNSSLDPDLRTALALSAPLARAVCVLVALYIMGGVGMAIGWLVFP